MTPKEHANKLVDKHFMITHPYYNIENTKLHAICTINEVLIILTAIDRTEHWQEHYEEVKQEIEKL